MRNYLSLTLIVAIIFATSSCQKEKSQVPFWNEAKKQEFQNTAYAYKNGTAVEYLFLSTWHSNSPDNIQVKYYTGVIGGQASFTDPTAADRFLYISDSTVSTGTFTAFNILFGSSTIQINFTGEIKNIAPGNDFDYRKITSLVMDGKTFLPVNNTTYFLAHENEIGTPSVQLITADHECVFTKCVNGQSTEIKWYFNGSEMSIITGGNVIRGTVVTSQFGTPMIQTATGELYIIQFYTLANSEQIACTCTMEFTLYKVEANNHKSTIPGGTQFHLVIGNC